ncbi:MAG: aminopeptidase [Anaerolineae bacterium]|nr:aminopeptidase [Anaerolineae bacterium]
MADPRMVKLAEVMVNYSLNVQPGEWVSIRGDYLVAAPFFQELYRQIILAGGHPTPFLYSNAFQEIKLKNATSEQLEWIAPTAKLRVEHVSADIFIFANENTRMLTNVDNNKQAALQTALRDLNATITERAAEGSMRWAIAPYPCQAFAQDANMSLSEYEDFVYKATFADQDDPVKQWQQVHDKQAKLVDWLAGKKELRIQSPSCDVSLSIEGRKFINADGHVNMPDGEIFTGPVEDSAEGWVNFTYPAIRLGREVEGIRLEFKKGKVVKASAQKNEEFLLAQIDIDEGARRVGELGIGTNFGITQFTKSMLFDEKIGGTFHMALGKSYPQTGGVNKSAIHWDMLCDIRTSSQITVDGQLFYQDGEFKI